MKKFIFFFIFRYIYAIIEENYEFQVNIMNKVLELSRTKHKSPLPQSTDLFGHVHNDYEVYFLLSGEVQYFIKSSAFVLKAGDLVVIPKNIIHKTVYSLNQSYERLLINFTEDILSAKDRYLLSELTPLHITIPSNLKKKIQEVFFKIEEEYNSDSLGKQSLLSSYITELLVLINRYHSSYKDQQSVCNHSTEIINTCAKYISEHCHSDITLSFIAKMAAMSESYFSREFKKNTGFGFNEYLIMNRLINAQKLLSTTSLPITYVATKCGFNDSNYFASVFKKHYGMTPYKYRKLNSK